MHMLSLVLAAALSTDSSAENYCHDAEINADWEHKIEVHRGERSWERLYALRVRLCKDIDGGRLSLEDAIEQFEKARTEEIDRLRKEAEEAETDASG